MIIGEFYALIGIFILIFLHLIDYFILLDSLIMIQFQTSILIYIGCFNCLKKFFFENEVNNNIKIIKRKDAILYAFKGSLILLGIYISLKIFNHNFINFIFDIYFIYYNTYSISCFIKGKISYIPYLRKYNNINLLTIKKIPLIKESSIMISQLDFLLYIIGFFISIPYYISKNWKLNNLIGIILSLNSMENIFLGEFKIGIILFFSLFIYDIFFVYFTNVMSKIIIDLDIPILLKFPNKKIPVLKSDFSTIGLGDIIIPGIFISLMLRFDIIQLINKNKKLNQLRMSYLNLKYFFNSLIGYFTGIFFSISTMIIFNHAQPALLFIVPIILFIIFFTSLIFNEFTTIWNFNEITFIQNKKNI